MIWPLSPVLPPQIVFKFQSAPAFIFEVILEILLAFLLWTGLARLRHAVNVRTSYRMQGSQTDLSNYATSNIPKSDVNKNVDASRTRKHTPLDDPAPVVIAVDGTPPIRITPATPPLSRSGDEVADEDLTDWEDAEESAGRARELAGSSSSTAVPAEQMSTPCLSFRPIVSLAPPPADSALLTSMPPAKHVSSADSTCDDSVSSCSRGSSPDISSNRGRSHTWSDVNEHPQNGRAHWDNSNDRPYDKTAETHPFCSDAHHQGVSATHWQHEYGQHHQGVSAMKWPNDQYLPQQGMSDSNVSQKGVSAVDVHCSADPKRHLSAERWQRLLMRGYHQVHPQPTIPSWNSAPDLSARNSSQESFPDSATNNWNAHQPQVSVLNRIPENLEKECISSWIPHASYPAGACGLINQLAHRNHSLKEVILAQLSGNLCVSEGYEASQDEDEDDGLDE